LTFRPVSKVFIRRRWYSVLPVLDTAAIAHNIIKPILKNKHGDQTNLDTYRMLCYRMYRIRM